MTETVDPAETPLTERFAQWLHNARAGETFIYVTAGSLGDKSVTQEQIATAELARKAFADGFIELAQKRRAGKLDYLAVKRREKRTRMVNGVRWQPRIPKPGYFS
jgi:hypothetical protein